MDNNGADDKLVVVAMLVLLLLLLLEVRRDAVVLSKPLLSGCRLPLLLPLPPPAPFPPFAVGIVAPTWLRETTDDEDAAGTAKETGEEESWGGTSSCSRFGNSMR